MSTYAGRGLHGQVVNYVGSRIMRGDLVPGETIDLDALLHDFGVSRTVVREALKVLTAKGLVDARPRLGTYVTERSRWQLLDHDVMVWRSQDDPDPLLVLELGEVRQVIEPAAAQMAAVRRSDEQLTRMSQALAELEEKFDVEGDLHVEADLRFHRAVLAAAGNELLERFEVVLEPALHARNSLVIRHESSTEFLRKHRAVFEAIQARDPDTARMRMQELVAGAAEDIASILSKKPSTKALLDARDRAL
ncbi:FadR family transcriptional regulator [Nakamurella antarctica]|uniref:FadR family transcriptional regulator n=1 Tax=Nakamurella antarctica TaxID=1902245 RepID=A0A3G8ZIB9_9ACTN|nr:FadR/GntR family transcriptional regulator [Nakamurella antarctica]AZI57063.1 FadR family transcriptional regulator [Nakamurella antarctica]